MLHSFGAKNYQAVAEVHLRQTIELSSTLTVVLFGMRRTVRAYLCPDILRRRFNRYVYGI